MSVDLDSGILKRFLQKAVKELKGEWVLVGGTLLPALGIEVRATVDIDLVGLGTKEAAQNLELMRIAESLGLPIESVNQAAAFFLRNLKYSKADLIKLRSGKSCTIYRPTVELYWKMKAERLSETDVIDCKEYLKFCIAEKDKIDKQTMREWLRKQISRARKSDRKEKLRDIEAALPS